MIGPKIILCFRNYALGFAAFFLFNTCYATLSDCDNGAIWDEGSFVQLMQTGDGSIYGVSPEGQLQEVAVDADGRYHLEAPPSLQGLSSVHRVTPRSTRGPSHAIVAFGKSNTGKPTALFFDDYGTQNALSFTEKVIALDITEPLLYYVTETGTLFQRNISTNEVIEIASFPSLKDTETLLVMEGGLVFITRSGKIFKYEQKSGSFCFSLISEGWEQAAIARFNHTTLIIIDRGGTVWTKGVNSPREKIGAFSQGIIVGNQRVFKLSNGGVFLFRIGSDLIPNRRKFTKTKKLISAGERCTVRFNIQDTYYQSKSIATNMFDWVFTDTLDTVTTLIATPLEEISRFFTSANLISNGKIHDKSAISPGNYEISLSNLPTFRSVHDVPVNEFDSNKEAAKQTLIKTYSRRHARLIEQIRQEPQLFFIRWGEKVQVTAAEVGRFFDALEKIKPHNHHVLVYVSKAGEQEHYQPIEQAYRFKFFNLDKLPNRSELPTILWRHDHYAWEFVFSWIETH
jgi:hypothetical protein